MTQHTAEETDDTFRDLIRRVREGSEEAAWDLVNQYGDSIRRAVRRALNEKLRSKFDSLDFVQIVWNSFFHARGKLDRFDRPEELAAYLTAMAKNKVGMEIRRRLMTEKYNVRHEQSLEQLRANGCVEMPSHQPAPEEMAIAREQWERLLEGQPSHYRQIIELRLQGHTNQQVADTLHLDERTVRRFLKKLLGSADV